MLAVVTGASSGIGAEFARKLASRGFDLTLVARREDRLRAIAEEISALHHVRAEALPADLIQEADRSRVADHIRSASDLGLLVNNAGFGIHGFFFETEPDTQERMHRLHILATMLLTHAALSNLIPKARSGTGVINVSSVAAFAAVPGSVSYGVTKAWMNAFTSGLAAELVAIRSPVRVQALCPGFTLTEFHDVVNVDRSQVPRALWLTPDFVVQESLRAFDRGQTIVIPDWRYKAIARFMRMAPQSWLRRAARRRNTAK
ncbi:MAG TPA: SDR family oxidoreductase [Bryobacteraceae bacterium]